MDELFEILTWAQLGLHQKPIGLLNINGFFDNLLLQLDKMVAEGFLKPDNRDILIVETSIKNLLIKMENYQPKNVPKWLDIDKI